MLLSKQKYIDFFYEVELCYPSLVLLQDKISDFFIEKIGMHTTAFPNHACDLSWPSVEVIDVVLFGDALHVLSDSKTWPKSPKYRIWALCQDMKKVISKAFGLPINSIGTIPRYSVFPASKSPKSLDCFNRDQVYFVMSSNYALGKNIELTLGVINELQQRFPEKKIHLTICGPKPDTYIVHDYIAKFDWVIPPIVEGNLGVNWCDKIPRDSIVINFSTNLFEDFGISLAQAQQAGFPLIISDWGAHHDIYGENVLKVPTQLHGLHISESKNMPARITKTTDFIIAEMNKSLHAKHHLSQNVFTLPNIVEVEELIKLAEDFNKTMLHKSAELHKASLYDKNNPIAQIINHFFES